MVAVEALVRWDHPERGMLLPGEFLPAADRYRLTGAIARRVLDVALGDLSRWHASGVRLGLTVNLSAADLRDESVVNVVAEALLEHRLPADVLTLDISETALGPDNERSAGVVLALHELGVHLALDDYGTGGTSLAQLHELPFGTVKLDGRFARDTAVDGRSEGVVRATVRPRPRTRAADRGRGGRGPPRLRPAAGARLRPRAGLVHRPPGCRDRRRGADGPAHGRQAPPAGAGAAAAGRRRLGRPGDPGLSRSATRRPARRPT